LRLAEVPASLAACGVTNDAVPVLAEEAARQWTARFNPREIAVADFAALYRAALAAQGYTEGVTP
jgi:alcohol dehydrogenase